MRSKEFLGDSSRSNQAASPPSPIHGDLSEMAPSLFQLPVRARQHVYRVGGLKIPVKNSGLIQVPRNRFARKYKELLHRMEKSKRPEEKRVDLDAFEPPIRKRVAPGNHPALPHREPLMRRSEFDRDVEDDGDND